ncbi:MULTISPECIES: AlpA family transcriptional regulator [Photorhabdus]|uniref:helix-turn-helix transcriptional regulator n=1 Tax=Photorhabdus TaxID=29487 RepID=UPI00031611C9|nr:MULTISPECIES: AlpA family transcriptional regulator [Photorhabdus]AWK41644.1 DNA-binding protein [Photorhabdus laumondii subsp. laumondii]AXG42481.1 AlpA family transcriptional regulator [Photorhabdus laumondii subsp. laumondii]AXG46968.1 AlpA family transcriptional regulator [Photorhabdus laumondii subsp. laumondii]MCC8390285.1 AlpA family transcriptional regulator [Photorhabdus laumondii]MCZ1248289.1 AlpA family transcriptional regulator [Photorhabdus laumondii subsp. laumondii]
MVQIKTDKHQKLIRLPEVIRRTGFGKTWIYTLIRAGKFPKQVKTGLRSIAFIESEIDAWIEKVIQASRTQAV